MADAAPSIVQQQDSLRGVRNFVSLLAGATSDQTFADTDGYAVNSPHQYQVIGGQGVGIEGQPVIVQGPPGSQRQGFPPLLLLFGLAAVILLVK